MKAYCVTSEKLMGFSIYSWVSTDVAVVFNSSDRCLYEIVTSPALQNIKTLKISQPLPSTALCIQALIPGCGAAPSAASNSPTSQPNQKSPFQLSRASGQASDFGQTIICVGCADGSVTFYYADVV